MLSLPVELFTKILRYTSQIGRHELRLVSKELYCQIPNYCDKRNEKYNTVAKYLMSNDILQLSDPYYRFVSEILVPITDEFFDVVTLENFPDLRKINIHEVNTTDLSNSRKLPSVKYITAGTPRAIKYLPDDLYHLKLNLVSSEYNPNYLLPSRLQLLEISIIEISNVVSELGVVVLRSSIIERMVPKSVRSLQIHLFFVNHTEPCSFNLPELEYFSSNCIIVEQIKADKLKKFHAKSAESIIYPSSLENLTIQGCDTVSQQLSALYVLLQQLPMLYNLRELNIHVPLTTTLDLTSLLLLRKVLITFDCSCTSNLFKLNDAVEELTLCSNSLEKTIILHTLPRCLAKLTLSQCSARLTSFPDNLVEFKCDSDLMPTEMKNLQTVIGSDYYISNSKVFVKYEHLSNSLLLEMCGKITTMQISFPKDSWYYDIIHETADYYKIIDLAKFVSLKELTISGGKCIKIVNALDTIKKFSAVTYKVNFDENVIPRSVTDLTLHTSNTVLWQYMPPNLKHVAVTGDVAFNIDDLPDSVVEIDLNILRYDKEITKLPKNLTQLKSNVQLRFSSECVLPPVLVNGQ